MDTTLITTLGTLLAACASAYFGWRAIQAQTQVQRAQVEVDSTKTETDKLLQQQKLLTEQANKLRQDLLDDNSRKDGEIKALHEDVRELRQRVEDMEDRNSDLRTQLRACLDQIQQPTDARGNLIDRRGQE